LVKETKKKNLTLPVGGEAFILSGPILRNPAYSQPLAILNTL